MGNYKDTKEYKIYLKHEEFEQELCKKKEAGISMSIDEINAMYKEYTGRDYYFPFNIYANDYERCESPFDYFSPEYEALYKKLYEDGTLPWYCDEGPYWR